MERASRELEDGERRWRAVEAWRASSGSVLLYFLPLREDGEVAPDDRLDRRAAPEPDRRLPDLDPAELEDLLAGATPLTETERRFRAPDGEPWLAQSVGPVWAEEDVAGGATGVLFTALAGEARRVRGKGGHVGEASAERLTGWWRRAVDEEGAGEPASDARG